MRHPAEYWIRFLITRKHSLEEIQGMCELADLGAVSTEYLRSLEIDIHAEMPKPFRPKIYNDRASQGFLRRFGIYTMWHPNSYVREAETLLGDGPVRALLETFILSPLRADQAIRKIEEKTGRQIHPKSYEVFRHYYWNSTLLSGAEWGKYIRERKVAHKDWLRCASTARGPQGVQLVLWKTGVGALRHVDAGKIFTDIRNIAYMKIKETEFKPADSDHAKMTLNYARVAKMAQEEVTSSAEAMQDILKSFQAFKMKHSDQKIPSIQQLTDGSFTEAEDIAGVEDKLEY